MNSVIYPRYVKLIETCFNVPEYKSQLSVTRHLHKYECYQITVLGGRETKTVLTH